MKVLYLSNKEVPYRVEFFNQLARQVELTVVYDTGSSGDRNALYTIEDMVSAHVLAFRTVTQNPLIQ